jgi:CRISPR/Cas system-associated exonuclease Cas4 (RecB family)
MGLNPKYTARPLVFGRDLHELLEERAKAKSWRKLLAKIKAKFNKLPGVHKDILGDIIEDYEDVMRHYEDQYGIVKKPKSDKYVGVEKWNGDVLAHEEIEMEFTVPFTKNTMLTGKVDGISRMEDGRYLLERKTYGKSKPSPTTRFTNVQTILYFDSLAKIKPKYKKLKGVIWDYIKSVAPSYPKKLKDKEQLSKAKFETITQQNYVLTLGKFGYDPAEYEEILAHLEPNINNYLQRIKEPFNDRRVKKVVDEYHVIAEEIYKERQHKQYANRTFLCDHCDYRDVCQAMDSGLDTKYIIKKKYIVKERGADGRVR